jgi:hypothetical protein
MALTESQKLAAQRITKMYPSANKNIIKDAMNQGMSEAQIKKMLGKPTDDAKVKAAMDRFNAAMAKPAAKASTGDRNKGGQRQADALARVKANLAKPAAKPARKSKTTSANGMSMPSETTTPKPVVKPKPKPRRQGMDPLGLASKRRATGTYDRSAVDTGKPKPKPKAAARNFNVGVSKGGVPFKEAFRHFRKMGRKTFTWNGKKYTTELAKPKGKK